MNDAPGGDSVKTNQIKINDPEVVFGHRTVQTHEAKWLCISDIYQKLYRPHCYDIGGTYMQNVADFWFSFKTEQVGGIFLLHLFISNIGETTFSVVVNSSSTLRIDKKNNSVYLQQYRKEFQFKKLVEKSHTYLTTYHFTELDVECFKGRKLYIAVSFPVDNKEGISEDIINNIKMRNDCGALLSDPVGSDFTIEAADGAKFQVHRVILAAHSEVFKAMLKEDTAESQNSCVKLIDIGGEDLRYMLEYMYTGTVKDVENVNFANLLMLADRYNIKGLWELSEFTLSEQIGIDNALDVLIIADMYDSEFLRHESLKFTKRNPEVLESSTFKDIKNPDLIKELCTYLAS